MKKTFCFILMLVLTSCSDTPSIEEEVIIETENIFNYDLVLTNQIEVDNVAKKKYTTINGNVIIKNNIENTNPIVNLDSLYFIKEITKSLRIESTNIAYITGFYNLKTISEDLIIKNNNNLNSIQALGIFSEVRNIEITDNFPLDIISLPNLKYANNIRIYEQYSRSNFVQRHTLIEMENLKSVENNISINLHFFSPFFNSLEKANLYFRGDFEEFSEFKKLESLSQLNIYDNYKIKNLNGLEKIKHLSGITLFQTINLESLNDLQNINSNSLERIQITDVPKISSIEIFNKQENINYLNLQQTGIINLNGISINNNSSEIFIENNINLENLDFTINAESLNSLVLINNEKIKDFKETKNIKKINSLVIEKNQGLQSFTLDKIEEINYFKANSNPNLSIISLKNLIYCEDLEISKNKSLDNLDDFINLIYCESLEISGNNSLDNLDGFINLEEIKTELFIHINKNLSDFCGLTKLFLNENNFFYYARENKYNPTKENLKTGICKK